MELLTILLALASSALAVKIDRRQTPDTIPGQWIATLKDDSALGDVLNSVQTLASTTGLLGNVLGGFETLYKYDLAGFKGFAFNGDDAVLDALSAIGAIESIEPDSIVRAYAPVAAQNETAGVQAAFVSQSGAPWGLGRISRRTKGSTTYTYDNSAGSGAYAYVIDTGINSAHVEFEGRATQAVNFISGESNADLNGHGTHCAGTIGSKTYGVVSILPCFSISKPTANSILQAKKINLIGVKVLSGSGSGSTSGIIAGIQWAVKNAQDNGRVSRSVLSMSLGGSYSSSFNSAVASAIQSGLFVAVAAGNDNDDSAYYSPASETTVSFSHEVPVLAGHHLLSP